MKNCAFAHFYQQNTPSCGFSLSFNFYDLPLITRPFARIESI
ncbi:hypothetical protein Z948_197 [Sulfitobacter donghicola DSW-25 = KCTC 12864 = JCM 14565]|nr:hypothetical protein Z948_197 [Sulfitobacter donghicola DSW-25 = KCTC 12864 = JCM 14565]